MKMPPVESGTRPASLEGIGKVNPEEGTLEESVEQERDIKGIGVWKDPMALRKMTLSIVYGWSFQLEKGHQVKKNIGRKGDINWVLGKAK